MVSNRIGVLPIAVVLCALLLPHIAAAQTSAGPMTVQKIGNSAFIAPDFKFTDFNGKTSVVAGAFGGYLIENAFFIGAGGYGLTDPSSARDMWYFGLVTGVYVNRDRPVGFGFKALIGGGEATWGQTYAAYPPPAYPTPRRGGPAAPVYVTGGYQTGIFVFEPEANVVVHMNKHLSLSGGVGYRFTGDPYWGYYGYNGYNHDALNGVTGTVSLQIGGGGN
jgi:hypothetical protein